MWSVLKQLRWRWVSKWWWNTSLLSGPKPTERFPLTSQALDQAFNIMSCAWNQHCSRMKVGWCFNFKPKHVTKYACVIFTPVTLLRVRPIPWECDNEGGNEEENQWLLRPEGRSQSALGPNLATRQKQLLQARQEWKNKFSHAGSNILLF